MSSNPTRDFLTICFFWSFFNNIPLLILLSYNVYLSFQVIYILYLYLVTCFTPISVLFTVWKHFFFSNQHEYVNFRTHPAERWNIVWARYISSSIIHIVIFNVLIDHFILNMKVSKFKVTPPPVVLTRYYL